MLIDAQGQPKLTDFGLAKQMQSGSELTGTGQILGTPSYMSPELAHGDAATVGPASDVYGLGALLFALLTGRPPFQGTSTVETIQHVMSAEAPKPRSLNPGVPRDLETICLKCLESSARETLRQARGARSGTTSIASWRGRPILARRTGVFERTRLVVPAATSAAGIALSRACFLHLRSGASVVAGYLNHLLGESEEQRTRIHELAGRVRGTAGSRINEFCWGESGGTAA